MMITTKLVQLISLFVVFCASMLMGADDTDKVTIILNSRPSFQSLGIDPTVSQGDPFPLFKLREGAVVTIVLDDKQSVEIKASDVFVRGDKNGTKVSVVTIHTPLADSEEVSSLARSLGKDFGIESNKIDNLIKSIPPKNDRFYASTHTKHVSVNLGVLHGFIEPQQPYLQLTLEWLDENTDPSLDDATKK